MKAVHVTSTMILALSLLTASAYAKNSGSMPESQGAVKSPNAAVTTHFTAGYQNLLGGHFNCSGERIVKVSPKVFTKDSQDCTISDIKTWPAGTYVGSGNPSRVTVLGKSYYWLSDHDGQVAKQITYIVTDNGDGTGKIDIVAYY